MKIRIKNEMIIDSHVHIGKTEKTDRYWTFDSYVALMDELGLVRTVAMPNISSKIDFIDLNMKFIIL